MTILTRSQESSTAGPIPGRYLRVLAGTLLAYALVGKGFAYIGIPPVYVGEMILLWGMLSIAADRMLGVAFTRAPMLALGAFMLWGAARTIPFQGQYGAVALRDAAIWGYGLFAIVVAVLLMQVPARLGWLVDRYSRFVKWFLILAPLLWLILEFFESKLPSFPGTGVSILGGNKGGNNAVHLAGIFAYLAVMRRGSTKVPHYQLLMLAGGLLLTMTGRAPLLAFLAGAVVVTLTGPVSRNMLRFLIIFVLGIVALWATDLSVTYPGMGRNVSFEQLVDNVKSIFSDSKNDVLSGSKEWRLQWWRMIAGYTFHGKYFWTGKGFGINLADDDGFQVGDDGSLRSPHNGHLTLLARAGVPGIVLWGLVQGLWAVELLDGIYRAKKSGRQQWAALFTILLAYWAAMLTNAAFDVYLEGPVGGIWYWCIYGVGVGARWIFDHDPDAFDGPVSAANSEMAAPSGKLLSVLPVSKLIAQ